MKLFPEYRLKSSRNASLTIVLAIGWLFWVASVITAHAQNSYQWTGGGSDGNWGTGANWFGGNAPSSLQSYLNFAGTSQLNSNNNYTSDSGGYQIYFNSGAGAFTLSGNAIKFYDYSGTNPVIQNDSSNIQTVTFQVDAEHSMNLVANTGNLVFSGPIYLDNSVFLSSTANAGESIVFNGAINNGSSSTGNAAYGSNISPSSGAGSVILNATNTYTGSTTVFAGTLQIGNDGATGSLSPSSSISISSGATLAFARSNAVTQGTDFSTSLSGGGNLTQAGGGTLTLTTGNSYTGTTAVNAGTLIVNGTQTGATGKVNVASGGALGGTGIIGGGTTVASGGMITGGTNGTVGTLSLTAGLAINGTYVADVIAGTGTGTGSDTLSVTGSGTAGTLSLGNTSVLSLAVQGTLSAAQYVLATYAALSGTFGSITGTPAGYQVDYNRVPGEITLDISGVPEPGTWLGGLFLCGAVGYTQRRRFRSIGIFSGCR